MLMDSLLNIVGDNRTVLSWIEHYGTHYLSLRNKNVYFNLVNDSLTIVYDESDDESEECVINHLLNATQLETLKDTCVSRIGELLEDSI